LCCEAWTQRAEDPGPAFEGVFGAQAVSLPATNNNTISAQQQPLMPIHQLKAPLVYAIPGQERPGIVRAL